MTDAVGLEVIVIDREHRRKPVLFSDVNEGGVCEVHRPIGEAVHQSLQVRKVIVRQRSQGDRTRANEPPRRSQFARFHQVKEFGQDGRRRGQR